LQMPPVVTAAQDNAGLFTKKHLTFANRLAVRFGGSVHGGLRKPARRRCCQPLQTQKRFVDIGDEWIEVPQQRKELWPSFEFSKDEAIHLQLDVRTACGARSVCMLTPELAAGVAQQQPAVLRPWRGDHVSLRELRPLSALHLLRVSYRLRGPLMGGH
jgi:hypothetical protein